mgnify:CR=1 FL=1
MRINLHAHREQFPAKVAAVSAQQIHGHSPGAPVSERRLEPQQAAIVSGARVGRHRLDVNRAANPLLNQCGWRLTPAGLDPKVPDTRPVLGVAFLMRIVQNPVTRSVGVFLDDAGRYLGYLIAFRWGISETRASIGLHP